MANPVEVDMVFAGKLLTVTSVVLIIAFANDSIAQSRDSQSVDTVRNWFEKKRGFVCQAVIESEQVGVPKLALESRLFHSGRRNILMSLQLNTVNNGHVVRNLADEYLLLPNGTWLRGQGVDAGKPGDGGAKRELGDFVVNGVDGGFDWKTEVTGIPDSLMPLSGLVRTEKGFVDLCSSSFWENGDFVAVPGTANFDCTLGTGDRIRFFAERGSDSFNFVGLEIHYSLPLEIVGSPKSPRPHRIGFTITENEPNSPDVSVVLQTSYSPSIPETKTDLAIKTIEIQEPKDLDFIRLPALDPNQRIFLKDEPGTDFRFRDGQIYRVLKQSLLLEIQRLLRESTKNYDATIETENVEVVVGESIARLTLESGDAISPGGLDCGVYAICASIACLGIQPNLQKLFSGEMAVSERGISARQMQRGLEMHGLHSGLYNNVSLSPLKRFDAKAILHLRFDSTDPIQHWAVLTGFDADGQPKVLDLPNLSISISPALLRTSWDGKAIVICRDWRKLWWMRAAQITLIISWICIPILVLRFLGVIVANKGGRIRCWIIPCLIVTFGFVWCVFSPLSYFRNSDAVVFVRSKGLRSSNALDIPECDFNEMKLIQSLSNESEMLLVDCRAPSDFARGHLKGAINLSMNFDISELITNQQSLESAEKIVCYCQSSNCEWARKTAMRLRVLGIDNLKVFTPGWLGWQEEQGALQFPK